MADNLKVFHNGAVPITNTDEAVLVQTTATTQAVIKDIETDSAVTPTLVNGDNPVFTLKYNDVTLKSGDLESLTGSEIIDVNSKLYYEISPVPTISGSLRYSAGSTRYSYPTNSSSAYVYNKQAPTLEFPTSNYTFTKSRTQLIQDNFDSNYNPANDVAIDVASSFNSGINQPVWLYYSASGSVAWYFRYDGNSTTIGYYGNVSDVNTGQVNSWSQAWGGAYEYGTFDPVNNWIAKAESSQVKFYNADSASSNVITQGYFYSHPGTSTYSQSAAVNDYIFNWPFSGHRYIYYFNKTTSEAGKIYSPYSIPATSHMTMAVVYEPTQSRYNIFIGHNNNMIWFSANASQMTNQADFTGTAKYSAVQNLFSSIGGDNMAGDGKIFGDNVGNLYWQRSSDNRPAIVKVDTSSTATFIQVSDGSDKPQMYQQSGWIKATPASGTFSSATPSLNALSAAPNLKVSGIEITGV